MNITEIQFKIKTFIKSNLGQTILIIIVIIISNIASFYTGKDNITKDNNINKEKSSISYNIDNIDNNSQIYSLSDPEIYKNGSLAAAVYNQSTKAQNEPNNPVLNTNREVIVSNSNISLNSNNNTETPRYVASKKGRVYYFTWCSGAKSILEENRVYFKTSQDARAVGLKPSTSCPDLD